MPFETERTRCYGISDTHFGALYADAEDAQYTLEQGLEGYWEQTPEEMKIWVSDPAKYCFLLGDIYEGVNLPRKHRFESIFHYSKMVDRHINHLRSLVKKYPLCKFIYVKGNHERIPEFDIAFDQLEKELGRDHLEIQSHFKKIGDGIFMHGDQAIKPGKYHVDLLNPRDYSGQDGRYRESYVELYRPSLLQAFHDVGNRYLPWTVGRVFHRGAQCARKIFKWCHTYDANHLGEPSIFENVNHFFSGHTHDPYTDFRYADPLTIDPKTGQSKIFHFYNTGASIFTVDWKFFGKSGRINRHCFNAVSVFLNSGEIENPKAKIIEVISFKWPQFRWSAETLKPSSYFSDKSRCRMRAPLADLFGAKMSSKNGALSEPKVLGPK